MPKTIEAYRSDAKAFLKDTSPSFSGQDIDALAWVALGVDRLAPVCSPELKDLPHVSRNIAKRAISSVSGEYDA